MNIFILFIFFEVKYFVINIFRDGHELRAIEKLHAGLLELNSKARMRVRPAAQLLSRSTAEAISYFSEKGLLKNKSAETAAKIIRLINDWFDVFNSRESANINSIKGPFGKNNFNDQIKIINEMTSVVETMRVAGHSGEIPFQNGILMSNKSLISLQR